MEKREINITKEETKPPKKRKRKPVPKKEKVWTSEKVEIKYDVYYPVFRQMNDID